MPSRTSRLVLAAILASAAAALAACKDPETPKPPAVEPEPPPPTRPTAEPPPAQPKPPASGTRTVVAERANTETWDKMIVAGDRLWVLTNLTRWTDGPMYVPASRLWSVPVSGGDLTRHLDLEGMGSLAADASSLYVAVNRDLAKGGARSGRVLRMPLAGGAPVNVVAGVEPRAIAVSDGVLWIDDVRVPVDGSKPPAPAGTKGAMAFAFADDDVFFTTPKSAGPGGDSSRARVFRVAKTGGTPSLVASKLPDGAKLPDEAPGLAVDAAHVYFCAVGWASAEAEAAGIVARVPRAGGDVEVLARDVAAPRRLWIDDANVYVLSGRSGRPGSIIRVAKAGGAAKVVAEDRTIGQATGDATSLYFSSDGTFDPKTHARLTPATLVRVVK